MKEEFPKWNIKLPGGWNMIVKEEFLKWTKDIFCEIFPVGWNMKRPIYSKWLDNENNTTKSHEQVTEQ